MIIVAAVATSIVPFRNFLDGLLNRDTYTATGAVVLRKLQAQDRLTVASGTFDVPVVVCNGKPTAYAERSSADRLLKSCSGIGAEKATVLVQADVAAVIDLSKIGENDVQIDGTTIQIHLPPPRLTRPTVDAESGVTIVALDTSILPGKLPDNYLALAARSGKSAVSQVAAESGLRQLGSDSAQTVFKRLLSSFGFKDVNVDVAKPNVSPS
jgi:hypothetical protein